MPIWGFALLFVVAVAGCPLSMWLMRKVMRREVTCGMCQPVAPKQQGTSLTDLEVRRAALDREIAALKSSLSAAGLDGRRRHADQG